MQRVSRYCHHHHREHHRRRATITRDRERNRCRDATTIPPTEIPANRAYTGLKAEVNHVNVFRSRRVSAIPLTIHSSIQHQPDVITAETGPPSVIGLRLVEPVHTTTPTAN